MHFLSFSTAIALCTLASAGALSCKPRGFNSSKMQSSNSVVLDESDYPAVLSVREYKPDGLHICTSTCVSPNASIIAAHCTTKETLHLEAKGARSIGWHVNPYYEGNVGAMDFSVVHWPDGVCGATLPLVEGPLRTGQEVTVLGFGKSTRCEGEVDPNESLEPRLRGGKNTIAALKEEAVFLWGFGCYNSRDTSPDLGISRGEKTATQPGDSGGPLLVDGKVAGVVSGGGPWRKFRESGLDSFIEVDRAFAGKPFFKFSLYAGLWANENWCHLAVVAENYPLLKLPRLDLAGMSCDRMAERAYGRRLRAPVSAASEPRQEPVPAPKPSGGIDPLGSSARSHGSPSSRLTYGKASRVEAPPAASSSSTPLTPNVGAGDGLTYGRGSRDAPPAPVADADVVCAEKDKVAAFLAYAEAKGIFKRNDASVLYTRSLSLEARKEVLVFAIRLSGTEGIRSFEVDLKPETCAVSAARAI